MSKHDPKVRIVHMRDHARKALEMIKGKERSELDENEMLTLALTRLVELIGEAAGQVPKETRGTYPQIPWPQIIGMRHRLIHEYDIVDHDILWGTIKHDLPGLLDNLEVILGDI